MRSSLPPELLATERGREAAGVLQDCIHCGLCLPACPTYQLLGNELDSPRGRIYLIKNMLEGGDASAVTREHLDRCLTCRSCETACPSGVEYHRLLTIGREEIEQRARRPWHQRLNRYLLRHWLPHRRRATPLLRLARTLRFLLPPSLKAKILPRQPRLRVRVAAAPRRIILAQGCVQPGLSPNTAVAAVKVLNALGLQALSAPAETCCGALSYHIGAQGEALEFARRNIDAWLPLLDEGAEAIVSTASGCGHFIRDYGRLLAGDADYAAGAAQVTERLRDIAQILEEEDLARLPIKSSITQTSGDTAWHCPCTARHGWQLEAATGSVLERLGFSLPPEAASQQCCGAGRGNALTQPEIAQALGQRKLAALQAGGAKRIITADIGCQTHLGAAAKTPVLHWIELVARAMG